MTSPDFDLELAQELTNHLATGDLGAFHHKLQTHNPHPIDVIAYFGNLAAELLKQSEDLKPGDFIAIKNLTDQPTPLFAQLVSTAANDDQETYVALVNTITDPDQAIEILAELILLTQALMGEAKNQWEQDWIQCRFKDIEPTDEAVMFEFKNGGKVTGKPHSRNRTDLCLWIGDTLQTITLRDARKGRAKIYRKPKDTQP